jgi:hypothetical protein
MPEDRASECGKKPIKSAKRSLPARAGLRVECIDRAQIAHIHSTRGSRNLDRVRVATRGKVTIEEKRFRIIREEGQHRGYVISIACAS